MTTRLEATGASRSAATFGAAISMGMPALAALFAVGKAGASSSSAGVKQPVPTASHFARFKFVSPSTYPGSAHLLPGTQNLSSLLDVRRPTK